MIFQKTRSFDTYPVIHMSDEFATWKVRNMHLIQDPAYKNTFFFLYKCKSCKGLRRGGYLTLYYTNALQWCVRLLYSEQFWECDELMIRIREVV